YSLGDVHETLLALRSGFEDSVMKQDGDDAVEVLVERPTICVRRLANGRKLPRWIGVLCEQRADLLEVISKWLGVRANDLKYWKVRDDYETQPIPVLSDALRRLRQHVPPRRRCLHSLPRDERSLRVPH